MISLDIEINSPTHLMKEKGIYSTVDASQQRSELHGSTYIWITLQ